MQSVPMPLRLKDYVGSMPDIMYHDVIGICPVCGTLYVQLAVWISFDVDIIIYMYLHPGRLPALCVCVPGVSVGEQAW